MYSILSGKNTIISAPTGSGKTEAFSIPILEKISKNPTPGVFALFVYPLNALIDDQVSKVSDLIYKCGLHDKVAVYSIHGGQSTEYKNMIISDASQKSLIIATNFDFINYHLILQDKKWNELFKNAKIIVMDEAHSYTSFHGSNVYHVSKKNEKIHGQSSVCRALQLHLIIQKNFSQTCLIYLKIHSLISKVNLDENKTCTCFL